MTVMKELIGSVVFIVGLLGAGSYGLRVVHDTVRKAALEKVAKGLPSLTEMSHSLQGRTGHKKHGHAGQK